MPASRTTFAELGADLGLAEHELLESLEEALRLHGPGLGGRFVAPLHPIGDDATSVAAVAAIRARSAMPSAR